MDNRDETNRGVLFRNTDKDNYDGAQHWPDYKGTFTDSQGVEFYLSAWIKKSSKGLKYMQLTAKEKEQRGARNEPNGRHAPRQNRPQERREEQRYSEPQPPRRSNTPRIEPHHGEDLPF